MPERPESSPRESEIALKISELYAHQPRDSLQLELATGKAIIDGLYGRTDDTWRRRRKRHPSLRKISALLGNLRSPGQLYKAIGAYALTQRYPAVSTLKHLKPGHLHAVEGIPEDKVLDLLIHADRGRLAVRTLHALATPLRTRGKGGRPRTPKDQREFQRAAGLELPPTSSGVGSWLESLTPEGRLLLELGLQGNGRSCIGHSLGIAQRRGCPKHIFVIESEDDGAEVWRAAVERLLHQLGYEVRANPDGPSMTWVVLERQRAVRHLPERETEANRNVVSPG